MYIEDEWDLSVFMLEIVVVVIVFGSIVGSAPSGCLADRFGRKWVIWSASVLGVGGSVIMALAPDIGILILGRFVVGLVFGV